MYKEVALDPQCLAEYHYYGLLKASFGFEKGRYLVAPLKEWIKESVQVVKASEIQPIKQKSIKNYLNKLQKSKESKFILLPKDRKIESEKNSTACWLDWVNYQESYRNFCSIISDRDIKHSTSYEEILDNVDSWKVSPTIQINKTEPSIISVILPLIRMGQELIIVDPYFKLASNKILQGIFKELQTYQTLKSITLVTSINPANPTMTFKQEFMSKFKFIPKFTLVIPPSKNFFHDRYMITDIATIKAGHGFNIESLKGAPSDMLSVGLCGKQESDFTREKVNEVITMANSTVIDLAELNETFTS